MERWYEPEKFFREATVLPRRGLWQLPAADPPRRGGAQTHPAFGFILQNIPFLPVSSTEIRGRIQSGGPSR